MWNVNIKETFIKVKDWDKAMAKKIQDKFDLTDYQMLCLAFAKGFVIGAILLCAIPMVTLRRWSRRS